MSWPYEATSPLIATRFPAVEAAGTSGAPLPELGEAVMEAEAVAEREIEVEVELSV
jgi:hypothetical protein